MTDLVPRLKALLARATHGLDQEEALDPARLEEMRTSAFLLLKTCAKHGVGIRFEVPKAKGTKPAEAPTPPANSPRDPFDLHPCPRCGMPIASGTLCLLCQLETQARAQEAKKAARRPDPITVEEAGKQCRACGSHERIAASILDRVEEACARCGIPWEPVPTPTPNSGGAHVRRPTWQGAEPPAPRTPSLQPCPECGKLVMILTQNKLGASMCFSCFAKKRATGNDFTTEDKETPKPNCPNCRSLHTEQMAWPWWICATCGQEFTWRGSRSP